MSQRIDAFELWCWRRLLRIPWTARRSNQSILKQISPGCSLEELMLKLKLQYFGHLMWRADILEKTLMLGKTEGRRRRGWQRMRWLDGITDSMDMVWVDSGSWWWSGRPGVLQFMGSQRVRHNWASDWTELIQACCVLSCLWDSPGKNTGVGSHALIQGIFLTQGWNLCSLGLLHSPVGSLPLETPGKPCMSLGLGENVCRDWAFLNWYLYRETKN